MISKHTASITGKPTALWILVADHARARLFERAADGAGLTELRDLVNPDGRGPEHDRGTDRPARVHERMGATRHAIEPHTSPREKSAARFAREIRQVLEQGRAERRYEQLVLIAQPQFLGTLHASLDKQVRRCVAAEIDREMISKRPDEILASLPPGLVA